MHPDQKLLHYQLTEKLGEGGMGVVWKATDTTLGREVAIKTLPADLAADEDRLARFDREARLLASLNHPNIAGIFGIHKAEDVHFLAMELVPGEDLSQRLERGRLPIEQALRIARDIATGLEAAHDNGVIHRDLKPANVKLTRDGAAKVLDFGLAKAADAAAASSKTDPGLSPTLTSAGTRAGMILGTAYYMSPEQAAGQPTDRRCDIWSFGVVLHELLTGKRLFDGETLSHTLAAVLRDDIDLAGLPAETPHAVRRLIERCLERDASRRLRDIGEARILLEDLEAGRVDDAPPNTAAAPAAGPGKGRFAYIAIAILAVAAMATMALWPTATPRQPLVQSTLMPPEGWDFAPGSPFAVSHDGRLIAFVANPRPENEESAVSGLWVRELASTESRRLADADDGAYPFWSPDDRWLAFYADGKLNKIEVRGGPVIPLSEATDGRGGTWNESGTIIFQRAWSEPLMKIPAGGGTPEPVTVLNKDRFDIAHRWPHFLPDGRHFLFYLVSTTNPAASEHSGIYIGSLDSDETTFLMKSESRALYANGHLLYRAGSTLMARPFDASALEFTGEPTPVATDVPGGAISWGGAQFGVSEKNEVLVHMRGTQASLSVLTWRDRDGEALGTMGEQGGYWEPSLSNDGSRMAVALGLDAGDIWIYDLERDTRTRFTFDPADDRQPLWSPDDEQLAFSSGKTAVGEIWVRPTSGQGEAELLFTADTNIILTDWASDGLILFSYLVLDDSSWDIWTLDPRTSEARPLVSGKFEQQMACVSPDGQWLAYVSDESGTAEVYVQAYPESGGRWMVSSDEGGRGAYRPVWRGDGRELFYQRGRSVMAVAVTAAGTPGAGISFGKPKPLFQVNVKSGQGAGLVVTDNGERLLTNELPPVDSGKAGARLIQNWAAELAGR